MGLSELFPGQITRKGAEKAASVQRMLKPYFEEIPERVWREMRKRPELARYESLDDYVEEKADELRRLGVPEGEIGQMLERLPVLDAVARVTANLRRRWRLANPDGDKVLVEWYGYTPIAEQRSGPSARGRQIARRRRLLRAS